MSNKLLGVTGVADLMGAGRLLDATVAIQRALGGLAPLPQAADPKRARAEGFLGKVDLRDLVRAKPIRRRAPVSVPDGAEFLSASFTNDAGSRPYKLYVPSGARDGRPMPLIVMLHGCTQGADDFAIGTRMNTVAEERGILVAYPEQVAAANVQKCWNWFKDSDQKRDRGEPSLIAGITQTIMASHAVDPQRVFIAGLSAGGAAAAIMGQAYPELYAAIGVHSGLARGAAGDPASAFHAMRHGAAGAAPQRGRSLVPTIVFHGDGDTTVSPANGDAVAAQVIGDAPLRMRAVKGQVPGGRSYTRTSHADADGRTVVEQWVVHGAPHAWAGGSPDGSYTDPRGPDASREMVRFFLETIRP